MMAVLFPHLDHPAIEERFASWQSRTLLRQGGAEISPYSPSDKACDAAGDIERAQVVVVTDPLILASPRLAERLLTALNASSVDAIVPVANESANPAQRLVVAPYVTLRELEAAASELETNQAAQLETVTWDDSDPGIFACKTEMLEAIEVPLRQALVGKMVGISKGDYVHRWASFRGQTRYDLLERIPLEAKAILEFGCGEAPLGAALKARQKCRVVGIEIDRHAAAIARKRIDDVYCGDVREIVELIHEKFDWIIGGDIVEHLDDPWSFLSDLRGITVKGGHLLLSIPNIANAAIINDLLAGRFDYVYMGLTCVGHLRFFTRHSIAQMMSIAGWTIERIDRQEAISSTGTESLLGALEEAEFRFSRDDLLAHGYYVTARAD
jgi:2-polyprenyl-3-methyl-5-hydroxy-6-metoxy-1,4-benzoquinol methylase